MDRRGLLPLLLLVACGGTGSAGKFVKLKLVEPVQSTATVRGTAKPCPCISVFCQLFVPALVCLATTTSAACQSAAVVAVRSAPMPRLAAVQAASDTSSNSNVDYNLKPRVPHSNFTGALPCPRPPPPPPPQCRPRRCSAHRRARQKCARDLCHDPQRPMFPRAKSQAGECTAHAVHVRPHSLPPHSLSGCHPRTPPCPDGRCGVRRRRWMAAVQAPRP